MNFISDSEALSLLDDNFVEEDGVIQPQRQSHTPSEDEMDAILYLIEEYDYTYDGAL